MNDSSMERSSEFVRKNPLCLIWEVTQVFSEKEKGEPDDLKILGG